MLNPRRLIALTACVVWLTSCVGEPTESDLDDDGKADTWGDCVPNRPSDGSDVAIGGTVVVRWNSSDPSRDEPFADATLDFSSTHCGLTAQATTDADGAFAVTLPELGEHSVRLRYQGLPLETSIRVGESVTTYRLAIQATTSGLALVLY
jgi:hypothetical protein